MSTHTPKTQKEPLEKYNPKHPLLTPSISSLTPSISSVTSGVSASFAQLMANDKPFTAAEATHSIKDEWLQKAIEEVTTSKMSGLVGTNLLLLTDSYKVSHKKQYPFGKKMNQTGTVYSYFESRGAGYWWTQRNCVFWTAIFYKTLLGRSCCHTRKNRRSSRILYRTFRFQHSF